MGEKLAWQALSSKLPNAAKIIDGHNVFSSTNLKPIDFDGEEVLPQHLDIVGMSSNETVKFICEVKTTTTKNTEFGANGYCMAFMMEAQLLKIPIYFSVVRLDREVNKDVIEYVSGSSYKINKSLYDAEMNYFRTHSKIEFYNEYEFKMAKNKFIIIKIK